MTIARKRAHEHVGSDFEELLRQERRLEGATTLALKRVLAWEIQQAMESPMPARPKLFDGAA